MSGPAELGSRSAGSSAQHVNSRGWSSREGVRLKGGCTAWEGYSVLERLVPPQGRDCERFMGRLTLV